MDKFDHRIVDELTRDARLSVRALAARVHLSRSAVNTRLLALLERGTIRGFTTVVDRAQLGMEVSAVVILKVDAPDWPRAAAELAQLPFVESVRAVSGDVDFVLLVNAPDHRHLSEVILRQVRAVPGVVSSQSYVVLEEFGVLGSTRPPDERPPEPPSPDDRPGSGIG